jgi:hypothetical protein
LTKNYTELQNGKEIQKVKKKAPEQMAKKPAPEESPVKKKKKEKAPKQVMCVLLHTIP